MDKEREKRIRTERNRLNKILGATKQKGGPEPTPKIKAAKGLIDNAAFMTIHLQDLQAELNEHGCVEEYRNGETQYGMKNPLLQISTPPCTRTTSPPSNSWQSLHRTMWALMNLACLCRAVGPKWP